MLCLVSTRHFLRKKQQQLVVAEVTNVPTCKRDFYTITTLQTLNTHFLMVLPHWGKTEVLTLRVIHSYLQKMQN